MRFVFHGIGSEYPFHSFASYVRHQGHDVLEIDMYQNGWRELINTFCLGGSYTLVTSHHPYMDDYRHQIEFGTNADIDSTPEFISKWRPANIFYVPHDIVEPIKDEEIFFIKNFTALLMPDSKWKWLDDRTQIFDVGFIKNVDDSQAKYTDITFLPSEIAFYLRVGWVHFYNNFSDILELKPRIKLPFFPGTQEIENRLIELDCEVVDSSASSTSLISRSQIVVSNGLSSIIGESSLAGVRTICVMDDIHPRHEQIALFGDTPLVRFADRKNAANLIRELLADHSNQQQHPSTSLFDYHRVLDIISN